MYAIVESGGTQYRVAEGDEFEVGRLEGDAGSTVKLDKVLLVSGKGDARIGTPYVKGAHCVCTILGEHKGKKVTVFKYRRCKASKRTGGHRQTYTRLKVEKIKV